MFHYIAKRCPIIEVARETIPWKSHLKIRQDQVVRVGWEFGEELVDLLYLVFMGDIYLLPVLLFLDYTGVFSAMYILGAIRIRVIDQFPDYRSFRMPVSFGIDQASIVAHQVHGIDRAHGQIGHRLENLTHYFIEFIAHIFPLK